jgi:hypothetical protein
VFKYRILKLEDSTGGNRGQDRLKAIPQITTGEQQNWQENPGFLPPVLHSPPECADFPKDKGHPKE